MNQIKRLAAAASIFASTLFWGESVHAIEPSTADFFSSTIQLAWMQAGAGNTTAAGMFCNLILTQPLNDPDPNLSAHRMSHYNYCRSAI